MRILVVADNPIWGRRVRESLEGEHRIIEREDTDGAVLAYELHQPDWVVVDLAMREGLGVEICERLKAKWPAARILVFTQRDSMKFRRQAAELGAMGYLSQEDHGRLKRVLKGEEVLTASSLEKPIPPRVSARIAENRSRSD